MDIVFKNIPFSVNFAAKSSQSSTWRHLSRSSMKFLEAKIAFCLYDLWKIKFRIRSDVINLFRGFISFHVEFSYRCFAFLLLFAFDEFSTYTANCRSLCLMKEQMPITAFFQSFNKIGFSVYYFCLSFFLYFLILPVAQLLFQFWNLAQRFHIRAVFVSWKLIWCF